MVSIDSHDQAIAACAQLFSHPDPTEIIHSLFAYLDNVPEDSHVCKAFIQAHEKYLDTQISASQGFDHIDTEHVPRVSLIVSTYASVEFIAECLSDCANQTVVNQIEIIIIDANSPENEKDIIQAQKLSFPALRYRRTSSRISVYEAWNIGCRLARGEFCMPVSTNDRLAPQAVEILMQALDSHPSHVLAYGNTVLTEKPHQTFTAYIPSKQFNGAWNWSAYSRRDLFQGCCVGAHPLWRRMVHEHIGYFDTRYKAIGDQDLWHRLAAFWELLHVEAVTSLVWLTDASLSGDQSISHREVLEVHCRHQNRFLYETYAAKISVQIRAQNIRGALEEGKDFGRQEHVFPLYVTPFKQTIADMVEAGKFAEGLAYYELYRCLFPDYKELRRFDELMQTVKSKFGVVKTE
jgi:glycosyltransferase involved in cell wall biosynthesis